VRPFVDFDLHVTEQMVNILHSFIFVTVVPDWSIAPEDIALLNDRLAATFM
jgi:hypothetical protein